MWFSECVLCSSLYRQSWSLTCSPQLSTINPFTAAHWNEEKLPEFSICLSEFVCICGLSSFLIFLCVWPFWRFLKPIPFLPPFPPKNQQQPRQQQKATVATGLSPLAEVQLTGCFATFSSTSVTWEGRSGTTLCWPIGHDHSYLILNIFILIYFHT